MISERHANFIVNAGAARAADVVALMRFAARAVEERFGVRFNTGEVAGMENVGQMVGYMKERID